MDLVIVAVGRARAGPTRALYDHSAGRLASPVFGRPRLVEVEAKRARTGSPRREEETAALLAAIPAGAAVVALDERGEPLTSTAFADRLESWRDTGRRCLTCVIGGADGLTDAVRARADLLLGFGAMTWPHMLVRAMLAEQLYRAATILSGHPYHREG